MIRNNSHFDTIECQQNYKKQKLSSTNDINILSIDTDEWKQIFKKTQSLFKYKYNIMRYKKLPEKKYILKRSFDQYEILIPEMTYIKYHDVIITIIKQQIKKDQYGIQKQDQNDMTTISFQIPITISNKNYYLMQMQISNNKNEEELQLEEYLHILNQSIKEQYEQMEEKNEYIQNGLNEIKNYVKNHLDSDFNKWNQYQLIQMTKDQFLKSINKNINSKFHYYSKLFGDW